MADFVKPKKHLGQHFLKDFGIAKLIVDALSPQTESLLEIGAGTGVLTQFILEKNYSDFKIIEIDTESVDYLKKHFKAIENNIIIGDFLRLELDKIFPSSFSIIGNFPYNISNQILFSVYENRNQVEQVIGMFQKEVAERIAAKPGSKTYGILSVLLQAYYDIDYLFTVNEEVFNPPPKVKSGVIRLLRNSIDKLECDEFLFKTVVKTAFNQRRKTVGNALKSIGAKDWPEEYKDLLNKRAEQLNVSDFVLLTNLASNRS
ncbi:MAG: 16S rRNA (adenine(1518)-N(6)/adenine(1519)-N(6))-dimethyltransferase RsmA [Bacteroidota bacterium]